MWVFNHTARLQVRSFKGNKALGDPGLKAFAVWLNTHITGG
jgi:hypothetical protein